MTLDDLGQAVARCCPLEDSHNAVPGERAIDLNGRTLTAHVIHYREEPKALPVGEAVAHEVHAPLFIGRLRRWQEGSQAAHPFLASGRANRQAF
jgi:hypothetical protein